ncbi:NAD-dependent epimerase/dehydratase family protein [Micromonospora sp. M12]
MRILVLGGTRFLGSAVARLAVAQGHDVTCAARVCPGRAARARFVAVDRDDPEALVPLAGEVFDAVVDVTRQVSHARHALSALADRVGHWSFVSTISVYADNTTLARSRPPHRCWHRPRRTWTVRSGRTTAGTASAR